MARSGVGGVVGSQDRAALRGGACLVGRMRPSLYTVSSDRPRTYVDKHGNTSTMQTGGIA
jgi:hypothetical protein